MSCYFRHILGILSEAGIRVTPQNKKEIDQAIHRAVEVTYKECPAAWKRLKKDILGDPNREQEFIGKLGGALCSGGATPRPGSPPE